MPPQALPEAKVAAKLKDMAAQPDEAVKEGGAKGRAGAGVKKGAWAAWEADVEAQTETVHVAAVFRKKRGKMTVTTRIL